MSTFTVNTYFVRHDVWNIQRRCMKYCSFSSIIVARNSMHFDFSPTLRFSFAKCPVVSTTVTLTKPTGARRSMSQKWENRATTVDCWQTSAPMLADFLVGRLLFCRSTQVKSFVDRSADFHGFCHRWTVDRWSPDDRPTISRLFEDFFTMISADGCPIIWLPSADDWTMTFYQRTVGRQTQDIGRHWADGRPTVGRS